MVSKKRLYYGGFDGFRAPVVPTAPRSVRRNSHKKSSVDSKICPFELLADVAGKLLQERENFDSASSKGSEDKEQIDTKVKVKPVSLDYLDHGCFGESEFVPEPNLELKLEAPSKDSSHSDNESGLEHASIVTSSESLKEDSTKLESFDTKNGVNCSYNKSEDVVKLGDDLTSVKSSVNHRVLNKSCSSVHLPSYRDRVFRACCTRRRSNVKIGIRDDDEKSFSCNHHSTRMKEFRLQSHGGNRRLRKMLTTKWKTAPKLKDYEHSNTSCCGVETFDPSRKNIHKRKRCQADLAFKKRKLLRCSSKPDYIQETSSESISSFQTNEGHVRFSIKSFKVPELYVEMPDTSTVGSLKRTIMEAVTAILEGELDVGVLYEGEKILDDDRTLQQMGVSVNSDNLGFILEPSLPQPKQSLDDNEHPLLLLCDNNQSLTSSPQSTNLDKQVEKNQESKPLMINEVSTEEIMENTKAIVPITPMVPMNQKLSKRSELSQRRTRRPFSVSEVEALVEAVETLGTGRWRDVKIRSFDDANHRTYVDLKDKWKTLVHTASISPQQRRGAPVPQNLLDRVLVAHSFWSQGQPKQHGKQQIEPVQTQNKLLLGV